MSFFKILVYVLLLTFFSCKWDAEDEDTNSIFNGFEQILYDENVKDEVVALYAESGDHLKIEIRGTKTVPKFLDEKRTSTSTWMVQYCWNDNHCRGCQPKLSRSIDKLYYCRSYKQKGKCSYNYRNHNGSADETIHFDEYSELFRLYYKIGENLYPLGHVLEHKGDAVILGFKISNEMIRSTNEVKLVVKPDPSAHEFNVGFLGFIKCAGRGRRGFNPHVNTSNQTVSSATLVRYKVNLYKKEK